MPIIAPNIKQQGIGVIGGDPGMGPAGERVRQFFQHTKGIPRRENLILIRQLEETHTVSLPMDTIKKQAASTDWTIRPSVEDPTSAHEEAADEIQSFLDGRFNQNRESFDHLNKEWINDVLSIDSGILELVPRDDGHLGEIYNRDGALFTKDPDIHNRLPPAGSDEPAYWQFSLGGQLAPLKRDSTLDELVQTARGHYGARIKEPIPFSRDQLVWSEDNPRPFSTYGHGYVQKVRRLVEIILNQDLSNRKYFDDNEVSDGLLNIVEANQSEIERFRDYWSDEVRGEEHVMPIIGGRGSKVEWIPFRPSPDELEFMESQQWYNRLVWMVFGLNQNEVGDISEVTRPGGTKQFSLTIFRRTTRPLLQARADELNNQVLPFHEAYQRVNGEVEFAWLYDNPAVKEMRRERQHDDLDAGLRTPNEIRQERGDEALEWGDMPLALVNSVARTHPGWALENWADVEDPPSPAGGGLLSAYSGGKPAPETGTDTGTESAPEPADDSGEALESAEPIIVDEELREAMGLPPLDEKEALRDEEGWWGEYPNVAGHIDSLSGTLTDVLQSIEEGIESIIEEEFPEEEADGSLLINPDPELDDLMSELATDLQERVIEANLDAMDNAAEFHAEELEEEAERAFNAQRTKQDDEAEISIAFDVTDTMAAESMERLAGTRMVTVSDTIKEKVRKTLVETAEDGGNVTEATGRLREFLDTDIPNHARLVARTETLDSSRRGSQALAESSDLIAGKEWNSTGDPDDGRTRAWHAEMNNVIVPKDDSFTVPKVSDADQPNDYPRSAFIVGEDQPFNCRCDQRPILQEDMPDDMQELAAMRGVIVHRIELSERMQEIKEEHAEGGERFAPMLNRMIEEAGSKTEAAAQLGISKSTLYDWAGEFDLNEFR